jgi:hypothetical protein
MKVTETGATLPPETDPGDAAEKAAGSGSAGKTFADTMQKSGGAEGAAPAPPDIGRVDTTRIVADIAGELEAGKISPQVAVDRVVERVLDLQLGQGAPAALRDQVAGALRQALEEDPMLSAKLTQLARLGA